MMVVMIFAKSDRQPYRTEFTNGVYSGVSDTTTDKGGAGSGFRPHDLLEAALAVCINMTVKMYADNQGIPLESVNTKVHLDRQQEESVFEYDVELFGSSLSVEMRDRLQQIAHSCPIRRTLSKKIRFVRV
jgi:putative redox protein